MVIYTCPKGQEKEMEDASMFKCYMAVNFTRFYKISECDYGYLHISIGNYTINCRIEYQEAVKLAYQLAHESNQQLSMENNPYDPMISTVSIKWFLF